MTMAELTQLVIKEKSNKIDINSLSGIELEVTIKENPAYLRHLKKVDEKLDKNLVKSLLKAIAEASTSVGRFNLGSIFIDKMDISREFFLELCEEGLVSASLVFEKTRDIDLTLKIANKRNEFSDYLFHEGLYPVERIEEFLKGDISEENQKECIISYLSRKDSFEKYPVDNDTLYTAMIKNAYISLLTLKDKKINRKELYFAILDKHPSYITESTYIRASDLKKAMELNISFTEKEVAKVRYELDRETRLLLILDYNISVSMFTDNYGKEIAYKKEGTL